MQYLNSPLLALAMLAGVIWLSSFSLHWEKGRQVSYNHSVFDVMPKTFKQRQAEALQDLYSITDEEIAKPVKLW